jgi:DNA-binding response OmpR family regulator
MPLAVVRAQPSGTFTENPLPGGLYATNAWLSGMSPAGLTSAALGSTVAVDPAPPPARDDEDPPQAASPRATAAAAAATADRVRIESPVQGPWVIGPAHRRRGRSCPGLGEVTARSNFAERSRSPATVRPMSAEILVVEDDEAIATGLVRVLDSQGYVARRVGAGRPALSAVTADVGLVLLDLGLPDLDGIDVCRRLRAAHPELAILIVTARDEELDIVAGLDAGADDYLVKPFRLPELLARVRAHLRRVAATPASDPPSVIDVAGVRIDPASRRVHRGELELSLRPKEFDLLALLAAEAGRVVTRERIMREVWDTAWMGSTKTLDNHILTLRSKLGDGAISTLRGIGYRLEA